MKMYNRKYYFYSVSANYFLIKSIFLILPLVSSAKVFSIAEYRYHPEKNPNIPPVMDRIKGVLSYGGIFIIERFDEENNCQDPSIPIGITAIKHHSQKGMLFI